MPRLIGERSDSGSTFALLFLLALIAGILLEYLGYINVVPGFERDSAYNNQESINQAK
ncbi:MAG TPA: hypothetical protein V6D28_28955 [Leptolyngbyaceae cyanobacterium]